MELNNYVLRIYKDEEPIEQRFVLDLKMAVYFTQAKANNCKEVWGEVFELKADDALLISANGSVESATENKKD